MGMVFGRVDVETPKYKSLSNTTNYEVREYPSAVAIETTMKDGNDSEPFRLLAGYIGVGGTPQNKVKNSNNTEAIAMTAPVINTSQNKSEAIAMTAPVINTTKNKTEAIAMTAPVITSSSNGNNNNKEEEKDTKEKEKEKETQVMQFILPSKYTMANAPLPTNSRVRLVERPVTYFAVGRYSGWWDESMALTKMNELIKILEKDNVIYKKPINWEWYRYNPPWTIPALRTNEIAIELDKTQFENKNDNNDNNGSDANSEMKSAASDDKGKL